MGLSGSARIAGRSTSRRSARREAWAGGRVPRFPIPALPRRPQLFSDVRHLRMRWIPCRIFQISIAEEPEALQALAEEEHDYVDRDDASNVDDDHLPRWAQRSAFPEGEPPRARAPCRVGSRSSRPPHAHLARSG